MTLLNIFVSYNSKNRRIVKDFVHDLEGMGHQVWLDVDGLTGGHEWWAKILEQIRQCDLFIAALTTRYFHSEPCKHELDYARALGKRILPVTFADLNIKTLPSYLQEIQIIDFQHGDKEQLLKLVKTLNSLPPVTSVRKSLPKEPGIPLSPVAKLTDKIDNLPAILDEQRLLIANLKDLIEDEDYSLDAWTLLEQLSERDDLLAKPLKELLTLLEDKPLDLSFRRRLVALEPRTFDGNKGAVTRVAFSPDSKYVLAGNREGLVTVWDTLTGDIVYELSGHTDEIVDITFSPPDGEYILTGSKDRKALLWESSGGTLVQEFNGHSEPLRGIAFAPNGQYVLTGSEDCRSCLWDTRSGNLLQEFKVPHDPIYSVAFAPNGKNILTGHLVGNAINVWSLDTGKIELKLDGHRDYVFGIAVSPDGKYVLTGSRDNTARLWDFGTGKIIRSFVGDMSTITWVCLSPSGSYALVGDAWGKMLMWEVATGRFLFEYATEYASTSAFSPNERFILVGTRENRAKLIESGID